MLILFQERRVIWYKQRSMYGFLIYCSTKCSRHQSLPRWNTSVSHWRRPLRADLPASRYGYTFNSIVDGSHGCQHDIYCWHLHPWLYFLFITSPLFLRCNRETQWYGFCSSSMSNKLTSSPGTTKILRDSILCPSAVADRQRNDLSTRQEGPLSGTSYRPRPRTRLCDPPEHFHTRPSKCCQRRTRAPRSPRIFWSSLTRGSKSFRRFSDETNICIGR